MPTTEVIIRDKINVSLLSKSQKEELCLQRYIWWRELYRQQGFTYQRIAEMFNRKSHATIISGIRAIDNMEETHDAKYAVAIREHKCFCTNEQPEYYI